MRRFWFRLNRYIIWKYDVIRKPETHNILHCRQRRTEPYYHVTRTENLVKFGVMVFEIRKRRDKQTDRHATRNTLQPYWWWGNEYDMISYQELRVWASDKRSCWSSCVGSWASWMCLRWRSFRCDNEALTSTHTYLLTYLLELIAELAAASITDFVSAILSSHFGTVPACDGRKDGRTDTRRQHIPR